ncbi:MAG: KH domain-containing protein [Acidimicrobiales bacterium]
MSDDTGMVDHDHDDDTGTDDDDHNQADAATAKAVLEYVVSALVEDEEAVRVDVDDSRRTLQLEVRVGPDDMGRVIGRRGRVANAIRTLTRAAAARDGVEIDVEFVD